MASGVRARAAHDGDRRRRRCGGAWIVGLWQPMTADIARVTRDLPRSKSVLAAARAQADNVIALERSPALAKMADPLAAVERVVAERGVRPAVSVLDLSEGRVRLTFAAVRFDALPGLLDALRAPRGCASPTPRSPSASSPAWCAQSSYSFADPVKLAAVLLFAFGCVIAALAAFLPARSSIAASPRRATTSCASPMRRARCGTDAGTSPTPAERGASRSGGPSPSAPWHVASTKSLCGQSTVPLRPRERSSGGRWRCAA